MDVKQITPFLSAIDSLSHAKHFSYMTRIRDRAKDYVVSLGTSQGQYEQAIQIINADIDYYKQWVLRKGGSSDEGGEDEEPETDGGNSDGGSDGGEVTPVTPVTPE